MLRRRRATCLERALVLQRWLAAHGEDHEVVIGVTSPGDDFRAHAWLEGIDTNPGPYQELFRFAVPVARPSGRRRSAVDAPDTA